MKYAIIIILIILLVSYISIKKYIMYYIKSNYKTRVEIWNHMYSKDDIVFLGDSITEGFMLNEFFKNDHLKNRGIYGDTTIGVLNRMDNILNLNPKKVFVLIGVNDLDFTKDDVLTIALRIKEIVDILNQRNIEVYLQSVYPVNESMNKLILGRRSNKKIVELNNLLKKIENVIFINTYDYLIENNQLNKKYTIEGLHLNYEGYKVVSEVLKEYVD